MRRRGFDPAGELAAALAARLDAEPVPCLARRGSGHQVGKRRAERIGHPPRIEADRRGPPQRAPGRRRADDRRDADRLRRRTARGRGEKGRGVDVHAAGLARDGTGSGAPGPRDRPEPGVEVGPAAAGAAAGEAERRARRSRIGESTRSPRMLVRPLACEVGPASAAGPAGRAATPVCVGVTEGRQTSQFRGDRGARCSGRPGDPTQRTAAATLTRLRDAVVTPPMRGLTPRRGSLISRRGRQLSVPRTRTPGAGGRR